MVDIPVTIAILPDHDGITAVPVVTLPDDFTIAVAVPITVAGSDRHAGRSDTHSNFSRTSRHRTTNSGRCDGYYCKTLDHCLFLGCELSENQFPLT